MKKKSLWFGILGAAALVSILGRCACKQKISSEATEYAEDSMITAKIKAQLAADDMLKAFQVRVQTENGNVQLSGFVDSQETVSRAVEIVNSIPEVKSLRNDLILRV